MSWKWRWKTRIAEKPRNPASSTLTPVCQRRIRYVAPGRSGGHVTCGGKFSAEGRAEPHWLLTPSLLGRGGPQSRRLLSLCVSAGPYCLHQQVPGAA